MKHAEWAKHVQKFAKEHWWPQRPAHLAATRSAAVTCLLSSATGKPGCEPVLCKFTVPRFNAPMNRWEVHLDDAPIGHETPDQLVGYGPDVQSAFIHAMKKLSERIKRA